jgi:hypothetical protein
VRARHDGNLARRRTLCPKKAFPLSAIGRVAGRFDFARDLHESRVPEEVLPAGHLCKDVRDALIDQDWGADLSVIVVEPNATKCAPLDARNVTH